MMDKADFLKRRLTCKVRGGVEQAVSSCLASFAWARRMPEGKGELIVSGLPLRSALRVCRECKCGARLMEQYEDRWGEFEIDLGRSNRTRVALGAWKWREHLATPETEIHEFARAGYPTH